MDSGDVELSESIADVQNTLEKTVKLENVEPCTQYTFSMYTRHIVGDKRKEIKEEKVITETTRCQG